MRAKTDGIDELELYDGQRASLPAKKITLDYIPKLAVTESGRELFALSESCYFEWLETQNDQRLIEKAVKLCRSAVALGYPHAVVRLGYYYDKDYVELDRTEEFRCRVACDYYGKVVYQREKPDGATQSEWSKLRLTAAQMMLDMLANAPAVLSRDDRGRYAFRYNADKVYEELDFLYDEKATATPDRDRQKLVKEVFDSCKYNKLRAPLFGVIRVSLQDARQLFAQKSFALKIASDIIILLKCGEETMQVSSTQRFAAFLNGATQSEVWIRFFNDNLGGHRFLNGKKRKALYSYVSGNNFEVFKRLEQSAEKQDLNEFLFSDDDVYYYMKNDIFSSAVSALEALIDKVERQKDW